MRRLCLPEMYKPWIQSQHLNTEVELTAHSAGFIAELRWRLCQFFTELSSSVLMTLLKPLAMQLCSAACRCLLRSRSVVATYHC